MKRVFLISPGFFHLDAELAGAFAEHGYETEIVIERPFGRIGKYIVRLNLWPITIILRKYVISKLMSLVNDDDFLFFVNPELLEPSDVKRFLSFSSGGAIFLWDALSVKKSHRNFVKDLKNKVITTDLNDAEVYGLYCLPLSFCKPLEAVRHIKYDLSWYGTLYGSRISQLIKIEKEISAAGLRFHFIGYCKSIIHYAYYYMYLRCHDSSILLTKTPVSRQKGHLITSSSQVVLDLADGDQWSLSYRCVETLKSQIKLITNNKAAGLCFKESTIYRKLNNELSSRELQEFIRDRLKKEDGNFPTLDTAKFVSDVITFGMK